MTGTLRDMQPSSSDRDVADYNAAQSGRPVHPLARDAIAAVRWALRPGGVLAVDVFGDRDDWASTDGTYLTRAEAGELFDGLDVLSFSEVERERASFAGPERWHSHQVIARWPGGGPAPQDRLSA